MLFDLTRPRASAVRQRRSGFLVIERPRSQTLIRAGRTPIRNAKAWGLCARPGGSRTSNPLLRERKTHGNTNKLENLDEQSPARVFAVLAHECDSNDRRGRLAAVRVWRQQQRARWHRRRWRDRGGRHHSGDRRGHGSRGLRGFRRRWRGWHGFRRRRWWDRRKRQQHRRQWRIEHGLRRAGRALLRRQFLQ
jgi:hypothetical protein